MTDTSALESDPTSTVSGAGADDVASTHLPRRVVLVDYENVPGFDVKGIGSDVRVVVYVGASQKTVPLELAMAAQALGDRLEWRRVGANGPNALDFFIACDLGRLLETGPETQCVVLSKDKGFDPLIRYLNVQGLKCKRTESLHPVPSKAEAPPKPRADLAPQLAERLERVVCLLRKSGPARPKKLESLSKHINAMFQNKLMKAELEALVGALSETRRIKVTDQGVTYTF